MPDDKPEQTPPNKDSLMGELESIKNLLNKDIGAAIPTLEQGSEETDDKQPPLLELSKLQKIPTLDADTNADEATIPTLQAEPDANTYTRSPQPERQRQQADFSIELLIQEIVDDYIPRIEAELLERLSQLDPELIRQLANKNLKP